MNEPRVLVLHNRYRVRGGEERSVELQVRAFERAGIAHRLLERDSAAAGAAHAAAAMLRGGDDPTDVAVAAGALEANVAHCHNMQPLLGPRALEAARDAGARVVLTLHNFRLFCAIGVAFRDGAPCFRCRRGLTLPGLGLNCRGSLPEAAVYATALARQLPQVLAAVDLFTTPSEYARGQLIRLGVPEDRIRMLRHYMPTEELAEGSRAGDGQFALFAGRLSEEKGVVQAIEACVNAGVPILVAGEGPLEPQLREFASRTRAGVELLGCLESAELAELRSRAAMVLLPSIWDEIAPYAALEAMAAGVPVVATRTGGLPEMVGEERCVPRGDPGALRQVVSALWQDPEERRQTGDALLERVRSQYSEERWLREILDLYG